MVVADRFGCCRFDKLAKLAFTICSHDVRAGSDDTPCRFGRFLRVRRAVVRAFFTRSADCRGWRGCSGGILRSQTLWCAQRHAWHDGHGSFAQQLQFVGGRFADYQRLGDAAIQVLRDFSAGGRADLDRRGLR